jgi:hypothetical protein
MVFLIFFSIRFKLFEMDIFVSRYVVYHSITFISMGSYLLITGVIIFWVQRLGVKAPLVVTGFLPSSPGVACPSSSFPRRKAG